MNAMHVRIRKVSLARGARDGKLCGITRMLMIPRPVTSYDRQVAAPASAAHQRINLSSFQHSSGALRRDFRTLDTGGHCAAVQ